MDIYIEKGNHLSSTTNFNVVLEAYTGGVRSRDIFREPQYLKGLEQVIDFFEKPGSSVDFVDLMTKIDLNYLGIKPGVLPWHWVKNKSEALKLLSFLEGEKDYGIPPHKLWEQRSWGRHGVSVLNFFGEERIGFAKDIYNSNGIKFLSPDIYTYDYKPTQNRILLSSRPLDEYPSPRGYYTIFHLVRSLLSAYLSGSIYPTLPRHLWWWERRRLYLSRRQAKDYSFLTDSTDELKDTINSLSIDYNTERFKKLNARRSRILSNLFTP